MKTISKKMISFTVSIAIIVVMNIVLVSGASLTKIDISPKSASINIGDIKLTKQLHASCEESGNNNTTSCSNFTLTWNSTNELVAKVGLNGLVTGLGEGVTTITASAQGVNSNGAIITVINVPPNSTSLTKIDISPQNALINIGDIKLTKQLHASCEGGSNNTTVCPILTWNSTNESVAKVGLNGLVTGLGEGVTTVTASAQGVNSNDAIITVINVPPNITTPLAMTVPADITKVATGNNTIVALGTPIVTGGVPPYAIKNDAPIDGFLMGQTTVNWVANDSTGNVTSGIQLVTIVPAPIGLSIINFTPSLIIEDIAPSSQTFNITTNVLANIVWRLDGVYIPGGQSVTQDSYTANIPRIGNHTVTVIAQNGSESDNKTWRWSVKGKLDIKSDPPSVNIGVPINVTFTVTRKCGIELGDNCTDTKHIHVSGANVSLTGIVTGYNITDESGKTVIPINATTNGTITAIVRKLGYNESNMTILADVAPPPPPSSSSGGSSGGSSSSSGGSSGGGMVASGEPYNNIYKYEIKDNYITITPVKFTYFTPDLVIYEIEVTGTQGGDASIRVEVLKGKSALVNTSVPGNAFKNLNVWIDNKRIKDATIRYKVENTWIDSNGFSVGDMKMFKWDGPNSKWVELPTTNINKDGNYTYFESKSEYGANSLSASFAVSGLKNIVSAMSAKSTPPSIYTNISENKSEASANFRFPKYETLLSLIVVGSIIYLYRKRRLE